MTDPNDGDDVLEDHELTGREAAGVEDGLDGARASRQLSIDFHPEKPHGRDAGPAAVSDAPARRAGRRVVDRGRRRNRVIAFAVLLLVVAAVAAWFLWPRPRTPAPVRETLKPRFEVVRVIDGPGTGGRPKFDRPLGAVFGAGGSIYVTDSRNGRVCVFGEDGSFLRQFGSAVDTGTPRASALLMPVGLDIDAAGTVYVADLRGHAVRVYDAQGAHLRDIAPRPAAGGEGWQPTDVAVSAIGIFVSDASGVERFRTDGRQLGRLGTTVPAGFDHPNGVAAAPDGTVLVSDTNHGRVLSLTPAGVVRWVTKGPKLSGGRLGLPRGLAAAPDGGAWVADAFGFDVAHISAAGGLIARYGERGTLPGTFQFPNDVDVRGDLLLVTDKENDRVQVLRVLR